MAETREKYLTDSQGNRIGVLLDIDEYQRLLDAVEELESIRAHDSAVTARDRAIPFNKAVVEIKRDRG
jgi:hypothetical protein